MSPAAAPEWTTAIVWFRRDLRLADHPALCEAVARAQRVVPLFVLDDRLLGAPRRRAAGSCGDRWPCWTLTCGRAASGLLVRHGRPEDVVPQVAAEFGAQVVLASRDVTPLSHRRDAAVAAALERDGRRLGLRPGLLAGGAGDDAHRRRLALFGVHTVLARVAGSATARRAGGARSGPHAARLRRRSVAHRQDG